MTEQKHIVDLDADQATYLDRANRLACALADLDRRLADMIGGVTWKTARGHEYLYRFWTEPLTRKKRFEGQGRRSPETEAAYEEFRTTKAELEAERAKLRDHVPRISRMMRALNLPVLPGWQAEVLSNLRLVGYAEIPVMLGPAGLLAHASEGSFRLSNVLFKTSDLTLVAEVEADIAMILLTHREDVGLEFRSRGEAVDVVATSETGRRLHVLNQAGLKRSIAEHCRADVADVLLDALENEPLNRGAIATPGADSRRRSRA